jgi:hypothetical protein
MNNPELYTQAPPYCHYYFDLIQTDNLMAELQQNKALVLDTLAAFSETQAEIAYAPGKWTVKEVFRHLMETERILAYRALRFSRMDPTPLPGFEEDEYILQAKEMKYDLTDLNLEFKALRDSTIQLFKPMTEGMLNFTGLANQVHYTPKTLGFMIIGHAIHHCNILKTRYLK